MVLVQPWLAICLNYTKTWFNHGFGYIVNHGQPYGLPYCFTIVNHGGTIAKNMPYQKIPWLNHDKTTMVQPYPKTMVTTTVLFGRVVEP